MATNSQTYDYNVDTSGIKAREEKKRREKERKAQEASNLSVWQRITLFFNNGRTKFVAGVALMLLGVYFLITFLSFMLSSGGVDQNRVLQHGPIENARQAEAVTNAGGSIGAQTAQFFIADGVGVAAFILVIWCCTIGYRLTRGKKTYFYGYSLVTIFSLFAASMLIGVFTYGIKTGLMYHLGGSFGFWANDWLNGLIGMYGMLAVNLIIALTWAMLCYKTLNKIYQSVKKYRRNRRAATADGEKEPLGNGMGAWLGGSKNSKATSETAEDTAAEAEKKDNKAARIAALLNSRPKIKKNGGAKNEERQVKGSDGVNMTIKRGNIETADRVTNPHDPTGEYMHYRFPTLDLLPDIQVKRESVDIEEQEANKQRITETLNNYGIRIKHITVQVGPTVTLFEIIPEDGVRISKIRNLGDDIALSLAALGIRIIAPMPGRGTIGIEVPNREPQVVPMRSVLASKAFQETKYKLPMVLGCTVANEVYVADLTKMPHLLVAGATGQGKSVGLNAIITSLLYKKGPSELKIVLIDPKKVEFSVYADIEKYFLAKAPGEDKAIITDVEKVKQTLNSLVQEMENRYVLLEKVKARKLEEYNEKWKNGLRHEMDDNGKPYEFMPYIVVIIDEFSDLIMTAGKEVETPIVRIAQKARAVGIHLIIATQRPQVKVITGLIKANVPGRVAFKVAQMQDSRIILDRPGAEQLIGRGDMLFQANGELTRLQCPLVDTPEVEKICGFIKEQEDADRDVNHEQPFVLPEYVGEQSDFGDGDFAGASAGDRDPLFAEVAQWVVQSDMASTSAIQRRYQIGYNRAGRLMDQMEAAGIVGEPQGSKPRKVKVDSMTLDAMLGITK